MKNDEEKVFGLFRRVHKKISRKGIGHYLVRKVLKNVGGKIKVKKELELSLKYFLKTKCILIFYL